MRGFKRNPWLSGLGVLLAILVVSGGHARADVNSDQPGSIVIFPKVVSDGTRDTLIQITNTSNMSASAHCWYINNSQGQCNEVDFEIFLTAQQPTMWRVSTGRLTGQPWACERGKPCSCVPVPGEAAKQDCPGTDPGTGAYGSAAVLPVGNAFVGELKCIQTQGDGQTPVHQNSLKGEAIIENLVSGQITEYNGLAIAGNPGNTNSDDTLLLDGTEYNACPAELLLSHWADGASILVGTPTSYVNATVATELTLVPCTELLEQQLPTHARALFTIHNEYEQPLSAALTFECSYTSTLTQISANFTYASLGSEFAKTRIAPPTGNICYTGSARCRTASGQQVGNCDCTSDSQCGSPTPGLGCRPWSGLLGVAEEFYTPVGGGGVVSTAGVDVQMGANRTGVGDVIVQPAGQQD